MGGARVIAQIEQDDGTFVDEEREPVCGADFCDRCGDCLGCYGADECMAWEEGDFEATTREMHMWVVYR